MPAYKFAVASANDGTYTIIVAGANNQPAAHVYAAAVGIANTIANTSTIAYAVTIPQPVSDPADGPLDGGAAPD